MTIQISISKDPFIQEQVLSENSSTNDKVFFFSCVPHYLKNVLVHTAIPQIMIETGQEAQMPA